MRPRFLKIKGLNSFLEEQIIDFSRLTERGFFGIFGPTGSGKSTILDAIIYALYGKVPRGAKEIMNTASEEMAVSYEFEIADSSMRCIYRVERTIKRDKHGNYRPPYARLLHLKADETIVLGDKIGTVENEIMRIIGLKAEDFTRSVVLPQGKFNEFLKLDGRPKRDMLERIFGLEKYGDQLLRKINDRKKLKELDMKELTGELKSYEGVSEGELYRLEEELKMLTDTEKQLSEALIRLELQYEKYKIVWELQKELEKYNLKKNELEVKKEEMNDMTQKLVKGKAASRVKPHMEALDNTKDKKVKSELFKTELKEKNKASDFELKEIEQAYNKAENAKENELPLLIKKQGELVQAIELQLKLSENEKEIKTLRSRHKDLSNRIELIKAKRQEAANKKNSAEAQIKQLAERIEKITIQPYYREKLNRGNSLISETKRLTEESKGLEKKLQDLRTQAKSLLLQYDNVSAEMTENDTVQEEMKKRLEQLEISCPGDNEELMKLQRYEQDIEKKLSEAFARDKTVKELKDKSIACENDKIKLEARLHSVEDSQKAVREELKQVSDDIKLMHSAQMAAVVADDLKDGEACPVCGSHNHPCIAEKIDLKKLQDKERRKEDLETITEVYNQEINELRISIATISNQSDSISKELDKLSDSLKEMDMIQLENEKSNISAKAVKLGEEIEGWVKYKKEAESILMNSIKARADIEGRISRIKANMDKDNSLLLELEEKNKILQGSLKAAEMECTQIKAELGVQNIEVSYSEMKSCDEEFSSLSVRHKQLSQAISKLIMDIEQEDNTIKGYELELATIIENGRNIREIMEVGQREFLSLAEGKEPMEYKAETDKKIAELKSKAEELKLKFEACKSTNQSLKEALAGEEKNLETLETIVEEQQRILNNSLQENGFDSVDDARYCFITAQHMQEIEDILKKYDSECKIVDADISRVKNNLKEDYIDELQWNNIKCTRASKSEEKEKTTERIFINKKNTSDLRERIKNAKALEVKKKRLEHEYSLLEDLYKLFQGNKFVEYIATNQLKYIAKDASQRLKEITRGRYALELDSSCNFIMRDDFNGGVRRSTDTLSGGETFYTSLALALALSSQVQMKGKGAPLEFFFLDEGFGTLDSELLDTVMSSLERLRSDRLCVGIISHVEELKNRVPVKLIVTPASAGLNGTGVNIEYS